MELSKHIEKSGLNVTEYAKDVGVSMATIYNALRGLYSPATARIIYVYSNHKVKMIIRPERTEDSK